MTDTVWRQITLTTPSASAEIATAALGALGAAGVQEDWLPGEAPVPRQPWDTGPLPTPPARVALLAWFDGPDEDAIGSVMDSLPGTEDVTWSDVANVDWEQTYRDAFHPIAVSDTLTIAPPWDAPEGALIIEPGQGFGTGDHPTTRLALAAAEALCPDAARVLDVGCGSGVLALACVRRGATAWGIDVDPASVMDSHANAALNHLSARFDTTPLTNISEDFDLVLANVHAEVLVTMRADLLRCTGRWLILGGVLADREALVRDAFDPHLTLTRRDTEGDWVGLAYERVG